MKRKKTVESKMGSYGRRMRVRLGVLIDPGVMDDLRRTADDKSLTITTIVEDGIKMRLAEENQGDNQAAS
jgi:hypothetical protein